MSKSVPLPNHKKVWSGKSSLFAAAPGRRFFSMLWLATLFSIVSLSNAYGAEPLLNKKVTLNMRNASLSDVLKEIERQADIVFVSSADDLKNAPKVNAVYNDFPVTGALVDLLNGTGLGYKVTDDYVTIFKKDPVPTVAAQQTQTYTPFSGRVVSAAGEPLQGVTILEQGTSNGAISDNEGRFSMRLTRPDAVVIFTLMSHEPVEMEPLGRTDMTITMKELVTGLDEVIVVAYGVQRKSSVTGAISTVSAKELTTVTSPNVNTMLQGKVAGVQVTNTSGRPGEAAKIRIRGKGSLGGESSSDPLWVIDGVISGTGSQLNPNDIATMSILKDAAATALFGSRATNGVILVTTKSGRVGENRVEANVKFGIAQQHLGKFKLMRGRELYNYTMSMDRLPAPDNDNAWLYAPNMLLAHNTDWFDFATRTGYSGDYTISHTMGTEKIRNFLSGNYYHETGTVRGYSYERFTIRDNIDIKVAKRLDLHVRLAGSYMDNDDKQHDIGAAMTYLPWDFPYNFDGSIRTGKEENWHGRDAINYLYNNSLNWSRGKQIGVNGTFAFDYRITDWLTFESNNNIGYRFNRSESYVDPKATGAEEYHGSISNSVYLLTTRYTNQLIRFNKMFDNKHDVSAFLGYEFSDYFYEDTSAEGRSIPADKEVLNVAAIPFSVGGNKYGNAMQSVYFNANYTFDNRYNAQFSFRRDGSSKYAPGTRYGNFWTIGAGWSLDREEFMRSVQWINYLKIRGSYGLIGNTSSLGNYDWMTLNTLTLAYNGIPAAFPSRLGNGALSWERCYEGNLALETRVFNRVSLVVDLYDKNTSGLLYRASLSSLSGYDYQYQNVGKVKNKGVEITLSPDLIMTKDWAWTMTLIYGVNRNKVMELANNNQDQISGNYIFRKGYDRDSFYLPEWAGVDVYTGQPLWYRVDASGEKSIVTNQSDATRVINGSAAPKGYGSIQTSVSWKSLTLSAMGNFVWGNKVFHYARQFYDNDGAYPTFNSLSLSSGRNWNRWEKPGDIATHPQAIWGGNNNSNQPSTRYLEDGSYFRLVNVSLSYDLPQRWMEKIHVSNGQVYVSGENLCTFTRFSGADIEVGVGKDNGISGLDVYPSARRLVFGINLSF